MRRQLDGLDGRNFNPDSINDFTCNVGVQSQYVSQFPVEIIGPQVAIAATIDKLHRNTHRIACPKDRPLDNRIYPEFVSDFRYRLVRILILHCRSSRNDANCFDFR